MSEVVQNSYETEPKFDMAACVHMLRHDIDELGYIRDETWDQVKNEELTYVAEGIDAPSRTSFELHFDEEKGFVNKRGDRLVEAYQKGHHDAQNKAALNPGLQFEADRRFNDLQEILDLEALMRGEIEGDTMVVFSPFPEEAYLANGGRELEQIGYQPQRKMGFIRICRKLDDNTLEQVNLSVDNSSKDAFQAAGALVGMHIPYGTETNNYNAHRKFFDGREVYCSEDLLLSAYDQELQKDYGQEFRAGRPKAYEINAWQFINSKQDLCSYYFSELENLAYTGLSGQELTEAKTLVTAAFWASLRDRMYAADDLYEVTEYTGSQQQRAAIAAEMGGALAGAQARHEVMIGCGGGVELGEDLLDESSGNIRSSIFNNGRESWVWKKGRCVVENCPSHLEENEVDVGPCGVCRECQSWFDVNVDPSEIYKPLPEFAQTSGIERPVYNLFATVVLATREQLAEMKQAEQLAQAQIAELAETEQHQLADSA